MKNGRKVPNCVPKEETQVDEVSPGLLSRYKEKAKTSDTSKMNPNKAFHRTQKGPSLAGAKIAAGKSDPDSQHALNRYKMSGGKVNVPATEETQIDERNKENKSKKDAAVQKIGSQNRGSHWLHRMNPKVADKIRGREVTQGKDRQWHEQVDEVSAGLAHRAAHAAWIKADKNKPPLNTPTKMSHDEFRAKVKKFDAAVRQTKKFASYASKKAKANEETQVDEVLDTTTSRMDYLQKAGKQMYGKGSADAKSQTFKKRLAGAKLFNRMTDRKPNVPLRKEEHEVNEVSSALLHRAFQKAKKNAGWLVPGDNGKGDKAWNRAKKFRDAGVKKQEQERKKKISEGGVRPLGRAYAKVKDAKSDAWEKHASPKNYRKPWEKSKADLNIDFQKAMTGFSGAVKKLPPGKKTPKAQIRPRDYMKPNQASKVGVTEQMSTHEPTPLSQRTKRVKSFHAWHPKPVDEVQRRADVKMVKFKLPDGRIVYRRERARSEVQHEMYTGSEPVSGNRADPANRFVGTNAIRQNYASVTPGQGSAAGEIAVAKFAPEKVDYSSSMVNKTRTEVDQSKDNLGKKHLSDIRKALSGIREQNELNESFSAGFEIAPFARDYGMQVQSSFTHHPEVQEALDAQEDAMNEAIYQGRDVALNKPMKGDVKKSKVYVRDPSTGNVKKVNFGDKKLSIKKDQPGRKKSYCARSGGQGNLTKKTSANYWSRRAWDC